jgi:hypothetical protein
MIETQFFYLTITRLGGLDLLEMMVTKSTLQTAAAANISYATPDGIFKNIRDGVYKGGYFMTILFDFLIISLLMLN